MPSSDRILVGAGRMGSAMLKGWLDASVAPAALHVVEPGETKRAELSALGTIALYRSISDLPALDAPTLVLAIKPQSLEAFARDFASASCRPALVISILAGIPTQRLEAIFPSAVIVRAMPNTPALIGKGVSVCVGGADKAAQAEALLRPLGEVVWLAEEALMDAVTAVSGSGPAYMFYFLEMFELAAVAAGLPADLAATLVRRTCEGALALAAQPGSEDLPVLRAHVTSPGGTTEAALNVLLHQQGGFGELIARAVAAASARSKALAGT